MSKAMDEREWEGLESQENKKNKLSLKLTKDNFLILALLGILFLVVAWPVEEKGQSGQQAADSLKNAEGNGVQSKEQAGNGCINGNNTLAYGVYLEETLEEVLSAMDGAGKVKVMITMESSEEAVLEKEVTTVRTGSTEVDSAGGSRNTTDITNREDTVYTEGAGSGQIPYVKKINSPKVKGVLVAAQGADYGQVAKNISEAIQALFGIEPHKIKIVKMNT